MNVLRYAHHQLPGAVDLLLQAARDAHPRVRLEAIVAASWLDNADGARVVLEALRLPLDAWMGPVTRHILTHTLKDDADALRAAGGVDLAANPAAAAYFAGTYDFPAPPKTEAQQSFGPSRPLSGENNRVYGIGKEVYLRDAHCATCHQANGKGLAGVYPPLERSNWLDDDERLIKLTLKGLWGPIEVNGVTYDPAKGVPPMTGFGGLLNDNELAAVLSYVRLSFGNNGAMITAEQVARVRAATRDRTNFYMVDELLKEHPLVPAPAPTAAPAPRAP